MGHRPRRPRDRCARVKQYLTYVGGSPFQPAIATGLRLPDEFFASVESEMAAKAALLGTGLRAAGFDVSTPAGSYFTVVDAAPLGATDADAFCRELPARAGVVGIPSPRSSPPRTATTTPRSLRFAACKRVEVLAEAAERLAGMSRA